MLSAILAVGALSSSSRPLPAPQDARAAPVTSKAIGPKDLTSAFDVAADVRVELWAESPSLYNPTAIDVDAKGRVWVAEAVNYRQWDGRNPGLKQPEGDRIVVLEDTDGDGACDRSTVFAQDKELLAPLGVCVLPSGPKGETRIMVSCSPSALIYTDTDGDLKADSREVFLTGFGGRDHDHGLHSFVVAPDGRYWLAVGNAGPHLVTDKSGWHLRSGSLYRDGGPATTDNRPGLKSDDGKVWTGGLILRVDPDGTNLRVMAHNFRNQYEVALDSYGRFYTEDNDDDGNQACRTVRCLEGGNHGYFSADGSRYWSADKRPGQDTLAAHWHQDDPGVVPAGTINGAGGPTGVCVYESNVLGAYLKDCVLDADAGRNCVWVHKPTESGSGGGFLESTLIAAKSDAGAEKDAAWFRPSDVCVAPDGSVYVSDWSDPGVGGHLMGDRKAYGRILRVLPAEASHLRPVALDLDSSEGRALALASPNLAMRAAACERYRRDRTSPAAEQEMELALMEPSIAARSLWLGVAGPSTTESRAVLVSGLRDKRPRIRALALRLCRTARLASSKDEQDLAAMLACARDSSPEVRTELALALRDVDAGLATEALVEIAARWDGEDRRYLEALGIGAEGKEEALWPLLAEEEERNDPLQWSANLCGIAWRLRPKSTGAGWMRRAGSMSLPLEARKQAIDALAFTRDRAAAEAVLNLAVAGPEDTRAYATWWIRNRDTNDWAEFKLARELGSDALEDGEMVASTGILTSGSKALDVPIAGAKKLWLVATEGKKGQSCDWADWIAPTLVTDKGEVPLTSLAWASAKAAWGDVNLGKNCTGGPLTVDGKVFADGIGTHALSTIAWDLPASVQRLKVVAAIDDGGSKQSSASDVEFQVWIDSGARRGEWKALERTLLDAAAKPADLERAAQSMCADPDGGLRVLQLAERKQLDDRARAAVARHIFSNSDFAVRALAMEHFTRGGATGHAFDGLIDLTKFRADPVRGAEIFFGDSAGCSRCHTFHGRGGDIGPDLSAIRTKYKPQELIHTILAPSEAIAFGYDTWLVETVDEELIAGFILSEGESVVMKDTSGRRRVLPASDIVSKTKQKLSLMPDDVALRLTATDLMQLSAFLSADPKAPGKRGAPIELFNGRDLTGWTCFLSDPKAKIGDVWSVKDGVLRCKGNPAGYLRTEKDWTSFELDVEWRFDPASGPGNSGVLMRLQSPDKVWPKSIEAQLQHRNAGDIWNIDDFAMQAEAARTNGRNTGKALPCNEKPIGEWNRYHIVLDGGELTLTVNGEVQNHASWCAALPGKIALQSEGAVIEFRKVTLTPIER